jgi:uncharacterized coiled-coil protein SlyX
MKMSHTLSRSLLIVFVFGFLALPQMTQATDLGGVLPGGNAADGTAVLTSLTTGFGNSGFGFQALARDTTGNYNTATGFRVLDLNVTGGFNTATGAYALHLNESGSLNTAAGYAALYSLTTGAWSTALGGYSLYSDTNGGANTAVGLNALRLNQSGSFNTAVGLNALYSNRAAENCAFGAYALYANTSATRNSAFGWGTLALNTTGGDNTAVGDSALILNPDGGANTAVGSGALADAGPFHDGTDNNTAIGYRALYKHAGALVARAPENTAVGSQALFNQQIGAANTAVGFQALYNNGIDTTTSGEVDFNTAVGFQSLYGNTTGAGNIGLGSGAGSNLTTGNNNIDISNAGVAAESNTIRIGTQGTQTATYVAGVWGATVTDGAGVIVDANGHLGTAVSSARFKTAIEPMDKASERILALRPVTFHYKSDAKGIAQFGLVAEDVAEVSADLVIRDSDGKPYTVRYEAVNAMLLNEFLKEHRKVEEQEAAITQLKSIVSKQEAIIAQQQKGMEVLTAQLKEQAAQIKKVSAQIELSKPVPRMAVNKP